MTRTSQAIDITGWDLRKVEGYLEAVRGDSLSVKVSLTVRTDGERQLTLSLTDDPTAGFIAHQCLVCDAITAAKVMPIPDIPGLNAPKALDPSDETDDEPKRTHDRRNGNPSQPH